AKTSRTRHPTFQRIFGRTEEARGAGPALGPPLSEITRSNWSPESSEVRPLFKVPHEDGSWFRAELDCSSSSSTIQPQQKYEKKIISFIAFPLFVCSIAYAQGITWTPANPMNKARGFFAAGELLNGNVLVAGGF